MFGLDIVEAVDIGQQDHALRTGCLADPGGEPVVVAEADFLGRDAVILVDHRHDAEREQPAERGRGVEIAAAILEIVERDEDLRCRGEPSAPSSSAQTWLSAIWPVAAAACASSRLARPPLGSCSRRAPSAIAPEETTAIS